MLNYELYEHQWLLANRTGDRIKHDQITPLFLYGDLTTTTVQTRFYTSHKK